MCGLAGLFIPRNATIERADIGAMLGVMRHRGPDGTGTHDSADRRFQAGFARLAIIDLATGDQPLVEEDGRRVLLGNGEIYNYLELRADLAPHPFRTSGDMEVVLPLMDRDGDGFVHRLNGMYALALYERDRHRLLLVRDRLGIKPLYWSRTRAGAILFASEPKALFASGLVRAEVDEESVSAYLAHGYVPGERTLYRGVARLPPGHVLTATADGTVEVSRYWRPAPAPDLPTDPAAIAPYLADLLGDSLRLQLRSDVPVGALLSGGLDSGLVVALAARWAERPLATFTVRFEGAAVDESPLAALVAERYATRHTVIDVAAGGAAEHLPALAWYCDEPLADASLLPNYLIERELGRHVTVALNGTGGDELFAGYGRYFRLPIEARYLRLPAWLRRGVVEPMADLVSPMTAWRLRRAEKFDLDRGGYLHDHSAHFPPPMRALMGNRQIPPPPAQRRFFADFAGPADSGALCADLCTYLPDDLLTLLDRTSMAVGVEGRVPFLDHRLVEAALAVPPEVRTAGGRQKALERTIAARFLPKPLLTAPKQGFASPVPAWMAAGLGTLAGRILTRPAALARGWWTREGIERLLAHPERHAYRLYDLLMLEMTVRLHVEDGRREPPTEGLEAFADAA
ncbi:MAG: asparagine synthase (glutamine-hydrolyzing) [Alphaproteobacteria bacterium]